MRILSLLVTLFCVIVGCCSPVDADQLQRQRPQPRPVPLEATKVVQVPAVSSMVATYCAGCHNGVRRSPSGALLEQFDATRIADNPDLWARAYRQLEAGTMPPVGAPRPDRKAYDTVLIAIEDALGAGSPPPSPASSQQVAARLASVLWNSAPDATLLDDAQRNRLATEAGVERQVKRMLADDRARTFVSRFFFPWLGLDRLEQADPDKAHFPDWDASLKAAMATETELFVLSQLREDRDPLELWSASYTFVTEPLARHYGMWGVTGAQFRRVSTTPDRAGLLGQGSVLMVTSRHQHGKDAGYTSPAARSIWVRMHFLGARPPNPAPNAQPVKPELPITLQTRALPAEPCVNCHRNFFPLGYALENFDPIGRWRTHDQAGPVDASGALVDGTPTNGVVQLRQGLLQRPDAFRTVITEKLLVHASGQPMTAASSTPQTLMQARQILRSTTATRWSALIAEVVRAVGPRPDPA
jgi:hypothetical protein